MEEQGAEILRHRCLLAVARHRHQRWLPSALPNVKRQMSHLGWVHVVKSIELSSWVTTYVLFALFCPKV